MAGSPPANDIGIRTNGPNPGIFETLTRLSPTYGVEAALAERWETPNPKTWKFFLRRDVTFHNGTPFNADAVVATLESHRRPGHPSPRPRPGHGQGHRPRRGRGQPHRRQRPPGRAAGQPHHGHHRPRHPPRRRRHARDHAHRHRALRLRVLQQGHRAEDEGLRQVLGRHHRAQDAHLPVRPRARRQPPARHPPGRDRRHGRLQQPGLGVRPHRPQRAVPAGPGRLPPAQHRRHRRVDHPEGRQRPQGPGPHASTATRWPRPAGRTTARTATPSSPRSCSAPTPPTASAPCP